MKSLSAGAVRLAAETLERIFSQTQRSLGLPSAVALQGIYGLRADFGLPGERQLQFRALRQIFRNCQKAFLTVEFDEIG